MAGAVDVYIVDDDLAVADAISELCDSVGLSTRVYNSAKDFLHSEFGPQANSAEKSGRCLILDVCMPELNGLQVQDELNHRNSGMKIIFVTGHGDIPMAVEAMRKGAFDFLTKQIRNLELLDSVRRALEPKQPDTTVVFDTDTVAKARQTLKALSKREYEVMQCVVRGDANKVVAIDLGISQRTVEIHRANIMSKLGLRKLADLIKLCVVAGEV